ncbi:MAG: hypothetical protein JXB49_13630, partial [Bacteroidales bacterium]|nr:hypothetical protein [Bacteroidales bacterium]
MKNLPNQKLTLVFFMIFLFLNTLGIKSQEKIVFNGVIDWAWSPRESLTYAGNGFYWWHRPTESPGYVTNYGQMPANDWTTPYDYSNGTFYFRFEVLEQPTNSPFSIQFGIWQDKSSQKEVVSTRYLLSGGPGTKIERSIGSPSTWHNVFPTDVDFTRPEDFYRMGLVLWKGSGSC